MDDSVFTDVWSGISLLSGIYPEYGIYVITNVPSIYFFKSSSKKNFIRIPVFVLTQNYQYYLYNNLYINETSQDFLCNLWNVPNN